MEKILSWFILYSLLLVSFGCDSIVSVSQSTDELIPAVDSALVGTQWDLVSFQSEGEEPSDIGSTGLLIHFLNDSTLKGRSYKKKGGPYAANTFFGSWQAFGDNKIEVSDSLVSTLVNEPEGSKYGKFLNAVALSFSYQIDGDQLKLFYKENKWLLFKKIDKNE